MYSKSIRQCSGSEAAKPITNNKVSNEIMYKIFVIYAKFYFNIAHRCGAGGSMRACQAAGLGWSPVGSRFLGDVFCFFYHL